MLPNRAHKSQGEAEGITKFLLVYSSTPLGTSERSSSSHVYHIYGSRHAAHLLLSIAQRQVGVLIMRALILYNETVKKL